MNSDARENWIKDQLESLPCGARILDAGAGECAYKKYCGHLEYVSQDFCEYNGSGDSSGLQCGVWNTSKVDIISDISAIPEPDNSFDAILCSEVFEHLPNPIDALKEIFRLLKKNGLLILTAPFCSLTHFSPYHFTTGFNKYYYEYHLINLDFEILTIEANGNYFLYMAQEIPRLPSVMRKYLGRDANFLEKVILWLAWKMCESWGKRKNKSGELLCFGYHILARKK